jgi:hypothetical protein
MASPQIILSSVVFQVRYAFGHTYLDRCGQSMVDIEMNLPDWIAGEANPEKGQLANPKKGYVISFNSNIYTFTSNNPNTTIEDMADNVDATWRIICQNLGLREFIRVAVRFNYISAKKSFEDSEKSLRKSKINIIVPDDLIEKGYKPKIRSFVVVLENSEVQYRVELKGIYRSEGTESIVIAKDPRNMSKKQKEAQVSALLHRKEFYKNTMYAVNLYVDCFKDKIGELPSPKKYMLDQNEIVKRDFVPMFVEII